MNTKRLKSSLLTIIAISFVFTACDEKKLEVKPYPQYHGISEKFVFNNKDFWNEDLEESIKDFKDFTKKTFDGIEQYKKNYKQQYINRKNAKYDNKNKIAKVEVTKNIHSGFDEVLDAQYK